MALQILIGGLIAVAVFADTKNAILYVVIGIIGLGIIHWVFRERVKQNLKFIFIVIFALACSIILEYLGKSYFTDSPKTSSFLVLLSYFPLVILFVIVLYMVIKHNRLKKTRIE